MRKQARQYCFQCIFEYLFQGVSEEDTFSDLPDREGLDKDDLDFLAQRLATLAKKDSHLRQVIGKYTALSGFTVERLYKTDLAVLLLGSLELLYFPDIPPAVVINEAVEIASKFSGEKSAGFVNGILASILRDKEVLREDN